MPFLAILALLCTVLSSGCLERQVGQTQPQTTNVIVDQLAQSSVDKIDLLFVIDNSMSMADKQVLLAEALPDLVGRLVSPVCVDTDGVVQFLPESSTEDCPDGSAREFQPVDDIHIAVITTSLGGYGSELDCVATPDVAKSAQKADMAHLVGTLPRGQTALASQGFLKWTADSDRDSFVAAFGEMVTAAGEHGCGWEASLESWYRFLVDPAPYTRVVRQNCTFNNDSKKSCIGPELDEAGLAAVDTALLEQRARFLRPDSLLAVILLSDENDCSFKASGQSWRLAEATRKVGERTTTTSAIKGTSRCDTAPNDPCCHSCGVAPPDGCPSAVNADDELVGEGCEAGIYAEPVDDHINLRCFQQKERFGVDYLYPTERYVNALRFERLCPFSEDLDPESPRCQAEDGTSLLIDNPIFDDLTYPERLAANPEATRAPPRKRSLVFFAGIVGVPWQDLAQQDAQGQPITPLIYRLNNETENDALERINWDWLLGSKDSQTDERIPLDPLMQESIEPRAGINPATREPLAPPDAAPMANSINGHEWNISAKDDLQYACVFPRPTSVTCPTEAEVTQAILAGPPLPNCDCASNGDSQFQNPLCQSPDGSYGREQHFAKAYPGIRQLEVLEQFGEQSIVASICPKQTNDQQAQDYGYRPAVAAIVDQLKSALADKCFPRPLGSLFNESGQEVIACRIVEATRQTQGAPGGCEGARARSEVSPDIAEKVQKRLLKTGNCETEAECEQYQLCEIAQLLPPENASCLEHELGTGDGWCYIDPDRGLGDASLVAGCHPTERRKIRFVGKGTPDNNSITFYTCAGAAL